MLFQLSTEESEKAPISKIPSMSEINYLNYINQARLGRQCTTTSTTADELNDSLKSTMLANLSANLLNEARKEQDKSCNLYLELDDYYQKCNFSHSIADFLSLLFLIILILLSIVFRTIIQYQSPTTGLFPQFSNSSNPNIGHVRDTCYCAIAVWSLRQCYCKVDNDKGRTYVLGQIAVKAMRGILFCWMRQAQKLEKFKLNPSKENALHSKFNIFTGEELNDLNYGHLQIYSVSFYLVTLAQMITSGLQVSCCSTQRGYL